MMGGGHDSIDKIIKKVCPPNPNPVDNKQLQCEECFKYWLHFLNQQQAQNFINDVSEFINSVNFDFTPSTAPGQRNIGCTEVGDNPNEAEGVECLPIAESNDANTLPQLTEICLQLELAVQFLAGTDDIEEGFDTFRTGIEAFISTGPGSQIIEGLMDCLEFNWLPTLEEDNTNGNSGMSGMNNFVGQEAAADEFDGLGLEALAVPIL